MILDNKLDSETMDYLKEFTSDLNLRNLLKDLKSGKIKIVNVNQE
jgi:hypothetical protein